MPNTLRISIPTPCHENWQDMAPADKGRFCASCQKTVVDFTTASNRQIAEAFKAQGNLCVRFRNDQLERDLVIPKEKSSLGMAASAAVLAFIALGNSVAYAQTKAKTEHHIKKKTIRNPQLVRDKHFIVSGVVYDSMFITIPDVNVKIKGTCTFVKTDANGAFSISAKKGDTLQYSNRDYKRTEMIVESTAPLRIKMENYPEETVAYAPLSTTVGGAVAGVTISQRPNFFVRTFHSIGNIFRKKDE